MMVGSFIAQERSRRTRKLLNDQRGKRRRGEPVCHVAVGDEQHPLLQGMPRILVRGERLGKHGALSDGPSAVLSGPPADPLYSTLQRAAAER